MSRHNRTNLDRGNIRDRRAEQREEEMRARYEGEYEGEYEDEDTQREEKSEEDIEREKEERREQNIDEEKRKLRGTHERQEAQLDIEKIGQGEKILMSLYRQLQEASQKKIYMHIDNPAIHYNFALYKKLNKIVDIFGVTFNSHSNLLNLLHRFRDSCISIHMATGKYVNLRVKAAMRNYNRVLNILQQSKHLKEETSNTEIQTIRTVLLSMPFYDIDSPTLKFLDRPSKIISTIKDHDQDQVKSDFVDRLWVRIHETTILDLKRNTWKGGWRPFGGCLYINDTEYYSLSINLVYNRGTITKSEDARIQTILFGRQMKYYDDVKNLMTSSYSHETFSLIRWYNKYHNIVTHKISELLKIANKQKVEPELFIKCYGQHGGCCHTAFIKRNQLNVFGRDYKCRKCGTGNFCLECGNAEEYTCCESPW